jgi:hypothetical protein
MSLHTRGSVAATTLALVLAWTVSAGSQGLNYPALYQSLGLPELPAATVMSTGRQSTSLRDGLSIRLSTASGVSDVRGFYVDTLLKSGWTVAPARPLPPGMPMAGLEATRDGVRFSATIMAQGKTTQVDLAVIEP